MHQEVKSDKPGTCPRCGMELVEGRSKPPKASLAGGGKVEVRSVEEKTSYTPLLIIVGLILLVTLVLTVNDLGRGTFLLKQSIAYFMAGFFIVFAGFKLLDLRGFAQGYSTYDLLAQKIYLYGYVYPFIELFFGLAMVAGNMSQALLWAEFFVMGISGIGVAVKLAKREKFQCVCLGTAIKLPLTKVTLVEDFGMAFLALLLLFM